MAYLPLSTANLPDPAIDPAQGSSPADYFGTLIWTGTGGSRTIADGESGVTGDVNFTPDFIWTKSRTSASSHMAYDTLRGFGDSSELSPNQTIAEGGDNGDLYGYVSGNTSGGFTTVAGSSNADLTNTTGRNYVAWNWKANGSGVSNTVGDIPSTVSVNTESGFSIVTWNGSTFSAGATVGHGLTQAPDLILPKNRGDVGSWHCYHSALGGTKGILLNSTNAESSDAGFWNNTNPTNDRFTVGTYNVFDYDYVAYCFHSVEGFSKFGSYTGNGSTDGTFVYTGFRPSFILTKRTDSIGSWRILDNKRSGFNADNDILIPNLSDAEYDGASNTNADILSNGFKLRTTSSSANASGATHIYMAFAENPFKYSNAR